MKILFICVANSARSQMAEGLARHILGPKFQVASAGSAPAAKVHPMAIQALGEIGIDIAHHSPKTVDDLPSGFLKTVDWVIPLCAEEQCPVLNGNFHWANWSLPDPAAHGEEKDALASFRRTRDAIQRQILNFKANIQGEA